MQKLTAIRQFITALDGITPNKLDAWTENISLRLKGKHKGNGLALVEVSYTAIIDIEDWPHKKHPVQMLFAQVIAWLAENDCDRDDLDNKNVSVVPQIHEGDTADLELNIDFVEMIEVVEYEKGKIHAFGKRWKIADVPIDIAETFTLDAHVK